MRKFMFVAGVVLAGSASASAPVAVFSGDFRISGVAPHAFDVLVRVGDTQRIEMEKGYGRLNFQVQHPHINQPEAGKRGSVLRWDTAI